MVETAMRRKDSRESRCNSNEVIYVRYVDHVLYNRCSALAMKPQTRETVGWLVYECEEYVTLTWDRDAGPPTLRRGDPKASGLVLLRSDILELVGSSSPNLNSQATLVRGEYAPTRRKTQRKRKGEPTA